MNVSFVCPRCREPLSPKAPDRMECLSDGLTFQLNHGIWHFLLPERADYYQRFIAEYSHIRQQEGRWSKDPSYYRALPFKDLTGERTREWAIRAVSFSTFIKKVIAKRETKGPLSILDLGAGNAWLSNRLAARGHWLTAVDIQTNEWDGLGACKNYETSFLPIQAEFDYLPLTESQFDIVVFNASFHYSENYAPTLMAALAVTKPGGEVIILDSPIYNDPNSGKQMVKEREILFHQKFGTRSKALSSRSFLTYAQISVLAIEIDCKVTLYHPRYPLGWYVRQLWVKIRGGREPAQFGLVVFEKAS